MYDQQIYEELQDINDNLQSFIQQENNNTDTITNCVNTNVYTINLFLGCLCLVLFVFNLLHCLPSPKRPLRREK